MQILSIDFFGTLDKDTAFWKEMLGYIRTEGIKVYIVSGLWPKELTERLGSFGFGYDVHYDDVASIFSYLAQESMEVWFDEFQDCWKANSQDWYNAKAKICKKLQSRVHFDNDINFEKAFFNVATRFVHLEDEANKLEIKKWFDQLKLANTYEDWEDDYMFMSGVVPM